MPSALGWLLGAPGRRHCRRRRDQVAAAANADTEYGLAAIVGGA
jgi:hypothetical protein